RKGAEAFRGAWRVRDGAPRAIHGDPHGRSVLPCGVIDAIGGPRRPRAPAPPDVSRHPRRLGMLKIALVVAALALLTPGRGPPAEVLPRAQRPEDVGLSAERLARLTRITQEHVEAGRLPGAVILIARHGKIAYFESFGFRDRERGLAMTPDALFRIYSMTKP